MIGSANTDYSAVGGLGAAGGAGGMGFGGGFGGIGLVGLIGLLNGRRGGLLGGDDCGDGGAAIGGAAVLAAITNSKDTTVAEGRGVLAAVARAQDTTVAEGRALAAAICEAEKTNMQQFYAAAIQASNNTQAIKDQATAFAIVADKRFDDLTLAGVTQTAAILARINDAEVQRLRDELECQRHAVRAKDVEISIQNTNTAVASQFQAQAQAQLQAQYSADRKFDALFNHVTIQTAKATNEIVNVGGLVAASQAANPTNIK